jgi:hypothetical protein
VRVAVSEPKTIALVFYPHLSQHVRAVVGLTTTSSHRVKNVRIPERVSSLACLLPYVILLDEPRFDADPNFSSTHTLQQAEALQSMDDEAQTSHLSVVRAGGEATATATTTFVRATITAPSATHRLTFDASTVYFWGIFVDRMAHILAEGATDFGATLYRATLFFATTKMQVGAAPGDDSEDRGNGVSQLSNAAREAGIPAIQQKKFLHKVTEMSRASDFESFPKAHGLKSRAFGRLLECVSSIPRRERMITLFLPSVTDASRGVEKDLLDMARRAVRMYRDVPKQRPASDSTKAKAAAAQAKAIALLQEQLHGVHIVRIMLPWLSPGSEPVWFHCIPGCDHPTQVNIETARSFRSGERFEGLAVRIGIPQLGSAEPSLDVEVLRTPSPNNKPLFASFEREWVDADLQSAPSAQQTRVVLDFASESSISSVSAANLLFAHYGRATLRLFQKAGTTSGAPAPAPASAPVPAPAAAPDDDIASDDDSTRPAAAARPAGATAASETAAAEGSKRDREESPQLSPSRALRIEGSPPAHLGDREDVGSSDYW